MTVNELITLFRRSAEDSSYTYDRDMPSSASLWSNFELLHYANEAQEDWAEYTFYFKDNENFSIDVVADTPQYNLDERILRIERAELDSTKVQLKLKSIEEFETSSYYDDYGYRRSGTWSTQTGTPRELLMDINVGEVRVYPIPTEADTINLTVRRRPLYRLTDLNDDLEVPERYQFGLIYKMQAEAFTNPKALLAGFGDALVIAQNKWENFLVDSAKRVSTKTRGPGKVRYGGI